MVNTFSELGHARSSDTTYVYNQFTSSLPRASFITTRGANDFFGPVYRTTLYHNTVYLSGTASYGLICYAGCGPSILTAKNNILWSNGTAGYADRAFDEGYNLYWKTGGAPRIAGYSPAPTSILSDPHFADLVALDLQVQSSSPAIDRASVESVDAGYSVDLAGVAVPQGSAPEIGAYECGTSSVTPTLPPITPTPATAPTVTATEPPVPATPAATPTVTATEPPVPATPATAATVTATEPSVPATPAATLSATATPPPLTPTPATAATATATEPPVPAAPAATLSATPASALLISAVSIANQTSSSAVVNWTTSLAGTSRVAYGTHSADLRFSTTEDQALTTAHSVALTDLRANTRYYYRVYSKDAAGIEYTSALYSFRTKNK